MRYRSPAIPALVAVLSACVTVNVYFPAAAAEQAADKIIDRVTGQGPGSAAPGGDRAPASPATPGAQPPPAGQSAPSTPPGTRAEPGGQPQRVMLAALSRAVDLLIPAAHAQGNANLDISTPQIRAITDSMQRRFAQLEPFFASGAIGMTADGLVSLRDPNAVPLAQRALVTRLVADDNRDRSALYAEIAKANGHPEWESDIRRTFARRWVERGAHPGWYYQDASGAWKRK